ncbi:DUF222 domain-containing protein [Mycolicibacterium gilvum]|uniref:DUF222 domain-containing protein n=1 Tax=Mycolicibacterium gilvum TaxID=1804 RepID=UPI0040464752
MFDGSLPEPATLAAASDTDLAHAINRWAAASAAAEARKLAAIAELHRRATEGQLHERDAVDDTDAAAAHICCALTISHGHALALIDLATTLRDRLPNTGARFLAGDLAPTMITVIAWRTALVTPAALPAIDTAIAQRAHTWGPLTQKKLAAAIDVWVHRYDPDAVRRTRNAMRGRYFAVETATRADTAGDPATGTVAVHGRLSATDAALTRQRLAVMIATVCPDDPRTMDQRRADALGAVMAGSTFLACACDNPDCPAKIDDGRATSITVHVLADPDSLHAEPDPDFHGDTPPATHAEHTQAEAEALAEVEVEGPAATGPARTQPAAPGPADPAAPVGDRPAVITGGGIVPAPLLAELIARGATVRLVTAANLGDEPRYRPSAALQRFVHARDITCRFPGCDRPATHADIDHTQPWPTGPTHPANTKCYCRLHHLIKTFLPGWADTQHPDGTLTITTPTGTHCVTKPLSSLLFPNWNTTTTPTPPRPQSPSPPRPGRNLRMPIRRRTRAHNRAAYITRERRLNATERAAEGGRGRVTPKATPRPTLWPDPAHPPDYGNDPPPF